MVREAIATGTTIEQAKEAALKALQAGQDEDVKFEILDIPQKKTLGIFGGSPARVKAYIENTPGTSALSYLKGILKEMGLENIRFTLEEEEEMVTVSLEGKDLGILIGRRGETLDALQYLTGLVANRQREDGGYCRVIINVGDYREKREKALVKLAEKVSDTALKYKRNQILEPMNPYERRIIHNAVQGVEGVSSWSIGDGAHRRVVIGNSGNDNGWNKSRSGSFKGGTRPPRFAQRSAQDERNRSGQRQPKADRANTPLYGRVEKE